MMSFYFVNWIVSLNKNVFDCEMTATDNDIFNVSSDIKIRYHHTRLYWIKNSYAISLKGQ